MTTREEIESEAAKARLRVTGWSESGMVAHFGRAHRLFLTSDGQSYWAKRSGAFLIQPVPEALAAIRADIEAIAAVLVEPLDAAEIARNEEITEAIRNAGRALADLGEADIQACGYCDPGAEVCDESCPCCGPAQIALQTWAKANWRWYRRENSDG